MPSFANDSAATCAMCLARLTIPEALIFKVEPCLDCEHRAKIEAARKAHQEAKDATATDGPRKG